MEDEKTVATATGLVLLAINYYKKQLRLRRQILNNLILLYHIKQKKEKESGIYCLLKCKTVLDILNGSDTEMKERIHISKNVFRKLVNNLKSPKSSGWNNEIQLLVFLIWLCKGATYREVSSLCGISTSTVFGFVKDTLQSILSLMPKVIHCPQNNASLEEIGNGFAMLAEHTSFVQIVGCINTWHIPVYPYQDGEFVENIKLCDSNVQFQAVCDYRCIFLDVCIGTMGIVEDVDILRLSTLYTEQLYPPPGYYLLANSTMPCLAYPITLIPPYKIPMNSATEAQFNYFHNRVHSVSDKGFSQIRHRWWELFKKPLKVPRAQAPQIVAAFATIHNFCLLEGDEWKIKQQCNDEISKNSQMDIELEENEVDADDIRDEIAELLPEPIIVPVHFEHEEMYDDE